MDQPQICQCLSYSSSIRFVLVLQFYLAILLLLAAFGSWMHEIIECANRCKAGAPWSLVGAKVVQNWRLAFRYSLRRRTTKLRLAAVEEDPLAEL